MSTVKDYNTTSQHYDTFRYAVGSDVIAGMVPFYCRRPLNELHLLDAGCGTGNYTKALLDAGLGRVSMLDASRGMLMKARDKLAPEISSGRVVEITEARLPDLPYPDSSFDAVLYNLVLHHLQPNPDGVNYPVFEAAICEAKRVLKKDGILIIGTAFPDTFISMLWYTKLSQALTDRYLKLFPNFTQISQLLDKNGLKLLSKLDHYQPSTPKLSAAVVDPLGPTKKAWRAINSYWAMGTEDEIKEIEKKVMKMHNDGTLESFVKDNNSLDYFYRLAFLFTNVQSNLC